MATTIQTVQGANARDPIWLDEPDALWRIECGHVDLFLARSRGDRAFGARRHVLRIQAGAAMFGFAPELGDSAWALIGQPSPDSVILHDRREQAHSPSHLIEAWVVALTASLSHDAAPKAYVPIRVGEHVDIPKDPLPLCGQEAVVWVTHLRGEGTFLGNPLLAVCEGPFPLARPAWIAEQAQNSISASSTNEVSASRRIWTGLDSFHRAVFLALVQSHEIAEQKERVRLDTKRVRDKERLNLSVRRLGSVLGGSTRRDPVFETGHPLMRAFQAVGEAQHITFIAPPEIVRGLPMPDPVRSVCRTSSVRNRRVALEDSWYRREGLPLFAIRESDNRPMALLPARGRGYEIYDPVEGTRTKVDATIAATLQPFAYTFYRPFHAAPVSLKYLCLFGLSGAWSETIYVLTLGMIGGSLGMVMPLLTATVFDTIIPGAQRQRMVETAVFLFAATLASALLNLSSAFTTMRIEMKVESKVQSAIFDRLLSLPATFFRKYTAGELAQRAAAISNIRQMLTSSATSALFAGMFSVFNFLLLFRLNPSLAMTAVALTAVQLVVYVIGSLLQYNIQRSLIDVQNQNAGLMLQLIGGIAKFRVSGTEKRAFSVWSKAAADAASLGVRSARISSGFGVFNSAFPLIGSLVIFYTTGELMKDPKTFAITTGTFAAFGSAYGSFSGALIQMAQVALGLMSIGPIYKNARPILDAVPERNASEPQAGELAGKIEMNHVSFRYREESPLVLKDVSFSIEAGQFTAFVGASGSGKSTIYRLLLGFEKAEAGSVYYDGQDMNTVDIVSIRQQIGVVLQDSSLFAGDIFQNIVCAAPYTLNDAWEAARLAGFEADLKAMPMGMQTIVGDGGIGLSGGQRQRLMIARALVAKPRILFFDEATSALDNQTQAMVSRSMESMRATRVVIAHRLTTVMKADRILVVDKGQIIQSGTYAELMAQPGAFAELAKRQLT